ncbi:hypothetical protein F9C28_19915, partial [Shimwellia pseudoproteus]|nr:hypothetical protein [Shimwellia pseudoproteus]
ELLLCHRMSLQGQECGDLILISAKSSIYSTKPRQHGDARPALCYWAVSSYSIMIYIIFPVVYISVIISNSAYHSAPDRCGPAERCARRPERPAALSPRGHFRTGKICGFWFYLCSPAGQSFAL